MFKSKISDGTVFQRSAAFTDCSVDQMTVIMNAEEIRYFAVNRVGARIWRLLESPHTLGALVQILLQEFAVDPALCRSETTAFLRQLVDRKLACGRVGPAGTLAVEPVELFGPAEWQALREAGLRRATAISPRPGDPARFKRFWAEWEIDAIARFTLAPSDAARFRLVSRGQTLSPKLYTDRAGDFRAEAFHQLRSGGASLALGSFEDYSNLALALSRRLEAEFRCPVQVNLYVTPGGGQGLGSHVDPHDVLVLQVTGQKTWLIHEGADPGSSSAETTLAPGGWLFLPKDIRHDVRNLGPEVSVHLTVGFHPLTWGEAFDRAWRRARAEQPEMNAPLRVGDEASDVPEQMMTRLKGRLKFADVREEAEAYYARFPALAAPVPAEHVAARADLDAIGEDTSLVWRDDALLSAGAGGAPKLALPYRRAPLIFQPQWAELLDTMRARRCFRPKELPAEAALANLFSRFLAGVGALAKA
ncbi:MAG TPA: PqqD family peptide modification chaperone [Opitutaceae bacterium]|nr:PqqD family peptide modification chaperone [Opitutaceae bacterium]